MCGHAKSIMTRQQTNQAVYRQALKFQVNDMGYQMTLTIIKPSSQKTSTDIGAIRFQSIYVEMEDFMWWMSCVKQTEETSEYWK
jgi:hypothetical protein